MEIPVGATCTVCETVDEAATAKAVGSGLLDVYATPRMIALMERAASECLAPHLQEGQSSVGTKVDVAHNAATPLGLEISATATVTAVDRRRVDFAVVASDGCEEIGRGVHTRFVIDVEKFLTKTQGKLK